MNYAKNKAYRKRCQAAGLCPHCGKPCAPYRECEARRAYKRGRNYLRRPALIRGPMKMKPNDPRRLPRGSIKFWTPAEDKLLLRLLDARLEPEQVAYMLERKPNSIEWRAEVLRKREARELYAESRESGDSTS